MTVLMRISSWWLLSARSSLGAAVADAQVVVPITWRPGELPVALEPVGRDNGRESLVEARGVAPEPPHAVRQRGSVGPAHAAGVEVLHHQLVTVFGGTENADRIRDEFGVLGGPLDEEPAAVQPLEGDAAGHDSVEHRVG